MNKKSEDDSKNLPDPSSSSSGESKSATVAVAPKFKLKGPRRGSHKMFPLPAIYGNNSDEEEGVDVEEQAEDEGLLGNKGPYGRPAYLPYEELLVPVAASQGRECSPIPNTPHQSINQSNNLNNSTSNTHLRPDIQAPGDNYALQKIQNKKEKTQAELLEQYHRTLHSDKYRSLSQGEAARIQQLVDSQSLPGGSHCRPLVGGFAAAAYEAAKAHHYETKRSPPTMGQYDS